MCAGWCYSGSWMDSKTGQQGLRGMVRGCSAGWAYDIGPGGRLLSVTSQYPTRCRYSPAWVGKVTAVSASRETQRLNARQACFGGPGLGCGGCEPCQLSDVAFTKSLRLIRGCASGACKYGSSIALRSHSSRVLRAALDEVSGRLLLLPAGQRVQVCCHAMHR